MARKTSSRKKKLRVGFVGVAGIANAHMNQLSTFDDVEVVAAADIKAQPLKTFQEKWNVPQGFESWKDMLKEAELDAVSVCTPNFLHLEPTIDALNAGCHVIVEKPIAMNAAEGQKMVDLAKKKNLQLTIAFQHRFEPGTQVIRKMVDKGSLGDIMYARVHAMRRRGIPNWGVFGRREMQGGGPMIDIGVHVMEMTHYAMGLPRPVSATGMTWTYLGNKKSKTLSQWPGWDHKTYTVEDLAVGTIRFENGAVMNVEAMFAGHCAPEDQGMKFELFGSKGAVHSSPLKFFFDHDEVMMNGEPAWMPKNDMWTVKMRNFVDASLHGKPNQSPGEHGLMIQKMIDAVYQSAETGKEVPIK